MARKQVMIRKLAFFFQKVLVHPEQQLVKNHVPFPWHPLFTHIDVMSSSSADQKRFSTRAQILIPTDHDDEVAFCYLPLQSQVLNHLPLLLPIS